MDILDYFDKLDELAKSQQWDALEKEFAAATQEMLGSELSGRIDSVDLSEWSGQLREELDATLESAKKNGFEAILFRYDPDTDWQGRFHTCPNYEPFQGDEEWWASEAVPHGEIITNKEFGEIYQECGPEADEENGAWAMLHMIARTVATLGRLVGSSSDDSVAICLAYSGQEHFTRIREVEKATAEEFPSLAPGDSIAINEEVSSQEIPMIDLPDE